MFALNIPGFGDLTLDYLVLDYNGTLAFDGKLIDGAPQRIQTLSQFMQVKVLTADTRGGCAAYLGGLPLALEVVGVGPEDEAKRDYVRDLGADRCVCVGNGANDRLMLAEAALGVAVVSGEGASVSAVQAADVVVTHVLAALDLLINPLRLKATLRR
jgi:soluble P-type ATPase